jgi:hypothetical protein
MKNFIDTNGNRNRDLPACCAVLEPTAPPAACPQVSPTPEHNLSQITGVHVHISYVQLSLYSTSHLYPGRPNALLPHTASDHPIKL